MSQYEPRDPELAYEAADQGFSSGTESRSDRSPEEIEREIERTRERMSRNIDELGDRLSPSNLKEEAKTAIKGAAHGAVSNVGEQARRTSSRLVEVIRENPLPVIAVGAGVTWLLTQRSRSDVSGNRMARYAYTGPERRQSHGIKDRVGNAVSGVKDSVSEAAGGVAERAGEWKEQAGEWKEQAGERIGDWSHQAKWQGRRLKTNLEHTAEENPLALAIGAAVVGLALGMLLPGTQKENEVMGSTRDQLVDRAGDVVERAKDAAVEAGREVKESIQTEIQQHKPEVKDIVADAGENVKDQVKQAVRRVKDETKEAAKKSGSSSRSNA